MFKKKLKEIIRKAIVSYYYCFPYYIKLEIFDLIQFFYLYFFVFKFQIDIKLFYARY